MKVLLNGRPTELPQDARVTDALDALGTSRPRQGVAVAVNGEVVGRGEWGSRSLSTDDRVEVLSAAQGG
jgi:sulfur carrier protein